MAADAFQRMFQGTFDVSRVFIITYVYFFSNLYVTTHFLDILHIALAFNFFALYCGYDICRSMSFW